MKKILTILLLLISLSGFGTDGNFYFSQTGDDGAVTNSIATPWKTITKFNTLTFSADDSVFFKRGEVWAGSAMRPKGDGTLGHNVVITAYGTGAKPIISAKDTVIGWSNDGAWTRPWTVTRPNVWYNAETRVGAFTAYRLWINDAEVERPSAFPPTAAKPWYWSGDDSLFVYSTTNPGATFTNMEKDISLLDATYSSLLYFTAGDNYFTVKNINFENGLTGIDIDDSQGIVIDSCKFSSWYGIRTDGTDGVTWAQDIEIKNCEFNPNRLQVEDGFEADYTQDGVNVGGSSRRINIHDNYFRDYGHSAYGLESLGTERVDTIKFYDNELTSPNVDYGNRMNVYYRFGAGNEIYRNYIHNIGIQNQINGRNLKVYYNLIDSVNEPSWSNNNGTGIYVGENANDAYPDNMYFFNNVIANSGSSGIRLAWPSASYQQIYDNQFVNNIIYNSTDYGIYFDNQDSIFDNTFKNNLIYQTGETDVVYYRGVAMTVDEFNDENGTEGDVILSNIGDDPDFTSTTDFNLLSTSPAINAGIDVGLTSDYALTSVPQGTYFDIGAYEFVNFPIAVTGLGWEDILSHRNFKGDVNIAGSFMVNGVPIIFSGGSPVNLPGLTASVAELNYTDGVTSGIQTQIDGKVALADSSATAEPNSYATGNMLEDGLVLKLSINDTTAMLNPYIIGSAVRALIHDSLYVYLSGAEDGLLLIDSIGGASGNDYFITPKTLTDSLNVRGLDAADVAAQINDTIVARLAAAVAGIRVSDTTHTSGTHYFYTQWQIDSLIATLGGGVSIADVRDEIADSLDAARKADSDSSFVFIFGAGAGGMETDTALFTTSNIYGVFKNTTNDTLYFTNLTAVMIAGTTPLGTDTLAIQVYMNDTINVALGNSYRKLNTDPLAILSITKGTEDTSFNSNYLLPDEWCWMKSPGVTTGRKPKALYAPLTGFKRNRSY